jgi:hypothetical protein
LAALTGSQFFRWADQKVDDLFLALLGRFNEQNQSVGAKSGTTYAPARFAEHPDAAGTDSKGFAKAMQRLLDAKKIRIVEDGPPSRRRSHLELADCPSTDLPPSAKNPSTDP